MSARSRLSTPTQSRSQISSNPTTRSGSRIRSKTTRDRSSPYGSVTRRANNNRNKSSSTTLKRSDNDKHDLNDTNNDDFDTQLSENEQQHNLTGQSDDDGDDESTQNTKSTIRSTDNHQSKPAHTTLTNDFIQHLFLNDNNNNTMQTITSGYTPMNKHVVANSEVYKVFDVTPNGLYCCKLCEKELKNKRFNTTNLRKHIGLVHKRTEFLYLSQRKNYSSKANSISIKRKKELDEAIISCIIHDSRPFNDFRKQGMRTFLNIALAGYIPPHRTTVQASLARRYAQHRHSLCTIFANVPAIALTCDLWKNSRGTHFICITSHFHDKNYHLISLTIGFRQLIGRHIAERLRKYILYEIKSLKIQDKICSITTDNATNIVLATTNVHHFGMRISCLAHVLNLIIQDALDILDKSMDEPSDDQSLSNNKKNFTDAITADKDVNYQSSDEDDDDSEDESEREQTENSSVTDLGGDVHRNLEESFSDEDGSDLEINTPPTDDTLTNIQNLVIRTRKFVKLTRRTSMLREYFQEEAKRKKLAVECLILDCTIRWNTVYYMLNRFITFQDSINQITVNSRRVLPSIATAMIHRLNTFVFNHNDWEHLIVTKDVLFQFEDACRLISGKRYPTFSLGYLILVGLRNHLTKITSTDPQRKKIEIILKEILYNAYQYHVNDKVSCVQKYAMMIACFLDPETYRYMSDDDQDIAQTYILNEARNRRLPQQNTISSATVSLNINNSTSSTTRSNNIGSRLNSFLMRCGLNPAPVNSTNIRSTRTIKEESAYYIDKVKTTTTFEEFWQSHDMELPFLSALVRSFNIRPMTSVPSESLFSTAAYINRKQRSSMSADAIRYSIILRDADIVKSLL